jgi:hypothetical protein
MRIPAPTELIVSKSSEAGAAANILKLVQSVFYVGRSLSLSVLVSLYLRFAPSEKVI